MSLFLYRSQPVFCPNCGKGHLGDPSRPCCSLDCSEEVGWKRTLYILGKSYYPMPQKDNAENT